jgi:hypothetical protein
MNEKYSSCFAWDAHKKDGIEQLEIVQRSAAMFVTNRRAKHINMLQHLKWCSLEDRHKDANLAMMYQAKQVYSSLGHIRDL